MRGSHSVIQGTPGAGVNENPLAGPVDVEHGDRRLDPRTAIVTEGQVVGPPEWALVHLSHEVNAEKLVSRLGPDRVVRRHQHVDPGAHGPPLVRGAPASAGSSNPLADRSVSGSGQSDVVARRARLRACGTSSCA